MTLSRSRFCPCRRPVGGRLNFRIASQDAALLVRWHYYRAHRKSLPEVALNEALELLKAKGMFGSPRCEIHLRIGGDESAVYIDLGQTNNAKVVRITSDRWSITTDCPIKFYRPPGFKHLPDPVPNSRAGQLVSLSPHEPAFLATA